MGSVLRFNPIKIMEAESLRVFGPLFLKGCLNYYEINPGQKQPPCEGGEGVLKTRVGLHG